MSLINYASLVQYLWSHDQASLIFLSSSGILIVGVIYALLFLFQV